MQRRYDCFWLCGLALAIGCQPTKAPDSAAGFGHFEGEVVASWDNDGRNMTLREEFSFVDSQDRCWRAPAGSVVNGASIPAAFWTLIGGPFEGQYRNASVVHDVGCEEMTASWEDVHRMFYDACRCGGVDETKAKTLYYAVYHFGPRWEAVTEPVLETRENANGQLVQERVTKRRMKRIDPAPPTAEEIEKVAELVADENPSPAVIEQTTREVLRRRPRRGRGVSAGRDRVGNHVGGQASSSAGSDRLSYRDTKPKAGQLSSGVKLSSEVKRSGSDRGLDQNGQRRRSNQPQSDRRDQEISRRINTEGVTPSQPRVEFHERSE